MPGVCGGFTDAIPLGAIMQKGLTLRTGQTHVQKHSGKFLDMILEGQIDTTFLISHRLSLDDGPDGYKGFKGKQDEFTKVVLKPS